MKPGIPWSVKGIEQQAREAAKEAARQSGMTIGEWLNSVILESADGNDDLERRYRRPPYRPRQASEAEQGDGEEVTLRLEEIAGQLHDMARHDSETALTRPMGPEDETQLRTIIERLDAHEQNTSSALGAMQERLEQVSQQLGGEAGHAAPQRPDDVPGYRALEGALRNIIEHIEISETRTRDSIRSLQERLTQPADGMAFGQLEQRVDDLAGRLAAEPNDLSEVQQAEQRLRGLVDEARQASGTLDAGEGLAQLRLEMEQLAATVSQGSGHALADLGSRLEQLESETNRRFSERDEETRNEVAALAERIAATEKRLEHLATIEESVAQLARSLEEDRSEARRSHADGPSPELKALEAGLNAVRASAETSDRRTQETLQAVHETLEQIVGKLAELEAEDEPDDREMDDAPTADLTEEPAEELAEEFAEEIAEEPAEELAQELASEDSLADSGSEAGMDEAEGEADVTTGMEAAAEGFVFPEQPTHEEAGSEPAEPDEPADEPEVATYEEPATEPAPAEPSDPPVREDYIAAARRAAQMSSRKQNPVTSGFNKFSQRMSGGAAKSDENSETGTQKRGFISSLFGRRKARQGDDAKAVDKKSKRKRLIFAGLVLLTAVSAYGGQRNIDSLPDFDQIGKALPTFSVNQTDSGAGGFAALWPEALTTASIAPAGTPAVEPSLAESGMLPEAIGPQSLRQAAIGGDAIAQFVVAARYLEGKAVSRDEKEAAQWYERAAGQGLAAAQYRLGSMYEHGRGKPLDRKQAVALYQQAAASGNINAMHNLAVLQTDDSGRRDYEQAATWFRKAAERGLKDSQFNLAVLHEQGLGVPRSPEDAVFWYSLAAVQGDEEAATKAKELEAELAPEAARQVRTRLMDWRALPADRKANAVPVTDPSWQELS